MEEVIDKAQKLDMQPWNQEESEAQLEKLRILRDRTFQDVREFVAEREKTHWREWDDKK